MEPQQIDMEFIQWAGENELPIALIFTKVDKNSKNKVGTLLAAYERRLLTIWEELPANFISSSETRVGKAEILGYIDYVNKTFNKN